MARNAHPSPDARALCFDPLALRQFNRSLKWQRRYRRLRKLLSKLLTEHRDHPQPTDRREGAAESDAVALRLPRRTEGGPWWPDDDGDRAA